MKFKVPVISVVGRSNSGKTTLIVKLVKELKSRGYKVATIKHSHHHFELDTEGKDSWLHTQAGADAVVVASQNMMGIMRQSSKELRLFNCTRWTQIIPFGHHTVDFFTGIICNLVAYKGK